MRQRTMNFSDPGVPSSRGRAPAAPAQASDPSLKGAGDSDSASPSPSAAGSTVQRRLVDIPAARAALGIGRSMLFELLRRGDLEAVKQGRRTFVVVESLDRYVAALPLAVYRPGKRAGLRRDQKNPADAAGPARS